MTEEEKVRQVFYHFEDGGLISKDVNKVLSCISDSIIGIGLGEQGFVTSKAEVVRIIEDDVKEDSGVSHHFECERVEIRFPIDNMAVLCAEITVTAESSEKVIKSRFSQSLAFHKVDREWKICCLHASTPIVTDENIEAYPLRFAEKTLKSLREKIGEEVYAVEEQYRVAILLDTIAFYIINFTTNIFEKCQLNSDICVYAKPGTCYERFARTKISEYVLEEDREMYLERFSLKSVFNAFAHHEKEVKCEYRMLTEHGKSYIWVVTIIRLITDIVTGEKKGIMYVKNIDNTKRQRMAMQEKAEYDSMLKIYNRTTFISQVDYLLKRGIGVFMMLDIDDFKVVNDTFGHPFGDKVLTRMAEILKNSFTEQAVLGRLGGDEFGIFLFGNFKKAELQKYMDILFCNMKNFIVEDDKTVIVTCSVGIAQLNEIKTFRELYQNADKALYYSKRNGKNCFSFYDDIIELS